jgi:SAM-dependent methyltransferase
MLRRPRTVLQNLPTLACPACGGATPQRFLYAKNGCDIFRCADCGLGRSEATNFDPATYYTGGYFSGQHADGYADYLGAEPVLRREFARMVAFLRRYRDGGRLLDVGCAYGFFLQEAQPYFDVAGIELAEDAAAFCRRAGLNVRTGIADEATLSRLGPMDVIVLLDVIEHLPDPRATFCRCADHLQPGGIMVLTTGDFASLYARLAGAHWRLMTPPQHLWFFTPDSIRRLAGAAGLTLESLDHPWKLVPLSLISFQLRRMLAHVPAKWIPVRRTEHAPLDEATPGSRAGTTASRVGLPVNLFDAMRIVLRKPVR